MQPTAQGMSLDRSGEIVSEAATAEDIATAVARRPRGEDWYLTLESDEVILDATHGISGGLRLSIEIGGQLSRAEIPEDDALLESIYASVLAGDGRWRELCGWEAPGRQEAPSADSGTTPLMAKAGIGLLAVLSLLLILPRSWMPSFLPEFLRQPGTWIVLLIVFAIPGLVLFAIAVKMREVRRAATWKQGRAQVVRSELVAQTVKRSGEASKIVNIPAIAYEFPVGLKRYHGTRISIGEIAGNDPRIPGILRRYSKGASVPVFYDPNNPQDCVLERDLPPGFGAIWIFLGVLTLVLLGVALFFLLPDQSLELLAPYFPQGAHPQAVLFFTLAGAVTMLSVIASRKQAASAAGWPRADGRIVASRVEAHRSSSRGGGGQSALVYEPVVEYAYTVAGREYHGSRVTFGGSIAAGQAWAELRAAAFPVGRQIEVHYDPANPSESVLEMRAAFAWSGLILALVFFGLATFFLMH